MRFSLSLCQDRSPFFLSLTGKGQCVTLKLIYNVLINCLVGSYADHI